MQVDNLVNIIYGNVNVTRIVIPQTHTNSVAQHGVYGEPPPSIEGSGGTMPASSTITDLLSTEPFTNPLLGKKTPDLGKNSQASNA